MKKSIWIILSLLAIGMMGCQPSSESNAKDTTSVEQASMQMTASAEGYPVSITLKGNVKNVQPEGQITLFKWKGGQKQEVSNWKTGSDGAFKEEISVTSPGFYLINAYGIQEQLMILTNENMEVSMEGTQEGSFEVKGSAENDKLAEFQELNKAFNEQGTALQQKLTSATDQQAAMAEYQGFITKVMDGLKNFIVENDTPYASFLITSSLDPSQEYAFLTEIAEKLEAKYPESEEAQSLTKQLAAQKSTAIGESAPEIALQSPEGEVVTLSSLKGKFVLIDFWASWCGPCRRENPNVVRMYQKFKDKDFEIYSVSLDRDRNKWLQAIEKDRMTWLHVSDLKFWQSEAARTYNVTAIPQTYLIDPEGKIIAKNLRGAELERKLDSVL